MLRGDVAGEQIAETAQRAEGEQRPAGDAVAGKRERRRSRVAHQRGGRDDFGDVGERGVDERGEDAGRPERGGRRRSSRRR